MPRGVIPDCGTDAGYQRHKYREEPIDEPCRVAHNTAKREAKANAAPARHCQCGTRLKTANDLCSRCRRKAAFDAAARQYEQEHAKPCPDRWVRRGLIWHPVYEERTEVA